MSDNTLDERTKKAFDFYADATKQLITLSTAVIALMITFAKDLLPSLIGVAKIPLMGSLVLYLFSIWFGLETLLGLTGQLQPYTKECSPLPVEDWPRASIYDPKVNKPSRRQVILFIFATSLVVFTGILFAVSGSHKST